MYTNGRSQEHIDCSGHVQSKLIKDFLCRILISLSMRILRFVDAILNTSILSIITLIISAFCVHIVHHAYREQIEVTNGNATLYAAEQK